MESRLFLKGLCSAERSVTHFLLIAGEALAWTFERAVPFSHLPSYPKSRHRILGSKSPKGSDDLRAGLVSVLDKVLVIVSVTSFIHFISQTFIVPDTVLGARQAAVTKTSTWESGCLGCSPGDT